MDFRTTLALGCGFLAVAIFAGWRGARPPDLMKGPRMIPWRFLMVLAAFATLVTLGRAAQLLGFGTP